MGGHIRLHPEKGVNPRLGCCYRCGKDVNGLVLVGTRDYVDTCNACGMRHYGGVDSRGYGGRRECSNKKCCGGSFTRRRLEDHEKIPMDLCDECKKQNAEEAEFYQKAGEAARENNAILIKHDACGFIGVLRGDHPIAIATRKKYPQNDRKLMGVTLEDDMCPNCREQKGSEA